jgi:hypothetical protein
LASFAFILLAEFILASILLGLFLYFFGSAIGAFFSGVGSVFSYLRTGPRWVQGVVFLATLAAFIPVIVWFLSFGVVCYSDGPHDVEFAGNFGWILPSGGFGSPGFLSDISGLLGVGASLSDEYKRLEVKKENSGSVFKNQGIVFSGTGVFSLGDSVLVSSESNFDREDFLSARYIQTQICAPDEPGFNEVNYCFLSSKESVDTSENLCGSENRVVYNCVYDVRGQHQLCEVVKDLAKKETFCFGNNESVNQFSFFIKGVPSSARGGDEQVQFLNAGVRGVSAISEIDHRSQSSEYVELKSEFLEEVDEGRLLVQSTFGSGVVHEKGDIVSYSCSESDLTTRVLGVPINYTTFMVVFAILGLIWLLKFVR